MKYSKFNSTKSVFKYSVIAWAVLLLSCKEKAVEKTASVELITESAQGPIIQYKTIPAANNIQQWIGLLRGRKIAVVANQTSVVRSSNKKVIPVTYTHLVDTLLSRGVDVKKVFAPEHGFRGKADAGAIIKDGVDSKSGLSIISLYGKNKKPTAAQLEDVDYVLFDIQDVGARFYTYISTLHYVMEACAVLDKKVIILDRPNPNGHYIDGPVLEKEYSSFVGMHPVPVVHGLTVGEYAQMINGQRWLEYGLQCPLMIIKMKDYSRNVSYELPIRPSPNLPNATAVNLYPSLCFFEGTTVSAGRGTDKQFQIYGAPYFKNVYNYRFTPQSNEGAQYPKFKNQLCYGVDLSSSTPLDHLNLEHLIDAYKNATDKSTFFHPFFTKLAGTKKLQKAIESGYTTKEIYASWKKDLELYEKMREEYLIYK